MDEPAVLSSERNRNAPRRPNLVGGGANAQDVVNNGRACREAELAAQHVYRQLTLVRPTTSVERGVTFSSGGAISNSGST